MAIDLHPDTARSVLMLRREGYEHLFCIRYEKDIIFRPLTIAEAKAVDDSKDLPLYVVYDWIVEQSVLHNQDWLLDGAPAGYAEKVAPAILERSTVSSQKELARELDAHREEVDKVQTAMELFICSAFKVFTPQDVRNMTQQKSLRLLAMAERVLERTLDLNPESKKPLNRRRREPPVRDGFSSMPLSPEASEILSEANADQPSFAEDNKLLEQI